MLRFFHQYRVVLSCGFFLVVSLGLAAVNTRASYRVDPVGVVLLEVMHPFQVGATAVSTRIGSAWNNYVALWSLREENERLRQRLRELEGRARRSEEMEYENRRLGDLLGLQGRLQKLGHEAIPARIVGRSPLPWVRTVVLDTGSNRGLRKGMAVLANQGVVGQIVSVTARTAQVLLVADMNSAVDAQMLHSGTHGIASGTREGGCILKYVVRLDGVTRGDTVLTSGNDGIFPKNQVIGTVERVGAQDGGMFQDVEVKLSVDLAKVEEVLVVAPAIVRAAE